MINQVQQPTAQQLDDGRKGKLPEPKPTLVGGKPTADKSHDDQRINPVIRVKIGGVSTPASTPNSATGGNTANGANVVNSPNSANGSNNIPQIPGVATVATGTSSPLAPSIAEQIARAGRVTGNTANNTLSRGNSPNSGVGGVGISAPMKAIATPTELIFDSTKGDIIGTPEIKSSSYQHDSATIILLDLEQKLATQILERGTMEVEIGYVNGFKVNAFVGDIRKVTRILPNKVKIFAVDKAFKAKASGTGTSSPQTTAPNNSSDSANSGNNVSPVVATTLAAGKTKPDKNTSPVTTITETTGTNQADQTIAQPQKLGFVQPGNSKGDVAAKESLNKGTVIAVDGNKVTEVSPGQAPSSGIIINWAENPGLFIVPPEVTKRNNFDLESGFGTLTVKGFNINGKSVVAATVTTPSSPSVHPTGVIQAPEWGSVKLSDPIVPGGRFTWAIATRDGSRVPESKQVMQGIIDICGYLIQWEKELKVTFEITSWYRDPQTNLRESHSGLTGPHTFGSAVDFFFEGMDAFHAKMENEWDGGVAISPGSFVHIDLIKDPARRRWTY
jgi:hypothetical protein